MGRQPTPHSVRVDSEGTPMLHWVEVGQGRPLVLIHGLSDSHRTWARIMPELSKHHRVLALDLPGHGLSPRPDASYDMMWHTRAVAAWFEKLGLEDADVVGHSFGGGISQAILLMQRHRVRRLALVASGGLGREVGLPVRLLSIGLFDKGLLERIGQPFMNAGTRLGLLYVGGEFEREDARWLAQVNGSPGTARATARTVRDVVNVFGQRRHFLDRVREVAELPPVALFWGERDRIIPVDHGLEMQALVEGVTLTSFPRAGHFPHREEPELFVHALRQFLENPHARPARVRPPVEAKPKPPPRSALPFLRPWGPVRRHA